MQQHIYACLLDNIYLSVGFMDHRVRHCYHWRPGGPPLYNTIGEPGRTCLWVVGKDYKTLCGQTYHYRGTTAATAASPPSCALNTNSAALLKHAAAGARRRAGA